MLGPLALRWTFPNAALARAEVFASGAPCNHEARTPYLHVPGLLMLVGGLKTVQVLPLAQSDGATQYVWHLPMAPPPEHEYAWGGLPKLDQQSDLYRHVFPSVSAEQRYVFDPGSNRQRSFPGQSALPGVHTEPMQLVWPQIPVGHAPQFSLPPQPSSI